MFGAPTKLPLICPQPLIPLGRSSPSRPPCQRFTEQTNIHGEISILVNDSGGRTGCWIFVTLAYRPKSTSEKWYAKWKNENMMGSDALSFGVTPDSYFFWIFSVLVIGTRQINPYQYISDYGKEVGERSNKNWRTSDRPPQHGRPRRTCLTVVIAS